MHIGQAPYDEACAISRYFGYFLWPLSRKARASTKTLTQADIDVHLPINMRAERAASRLECVWHNELELSRHRPNLTYVVARTYRCEILLYFLLALVLECLCGSAVYVAFTRLCEVFGDWSLYRYANEQGNATSFNFTDGSFSTVTYPIRYVAEKYDENEAQLYIWAPVLVAITCFCVIMRQTYRCGLQHVGLKLRAALAHMIFSKATRIDASMPLKCEDSDLGEPSGLHHSNAMNLIASDLDRIERSFATLIDVFIGPLNAIAVTIAFGCMFNYVAALAALGVSAIIALIFIIWTSARRSNARIASIWSDKRARLYIDLLRCSKSLKLAGWLESAMRRAALIRECESSARRSDLWALCIEKFVYIIAYPAGTAALLAFLQHVQHIHLINLNVMPSVFLCWIYSRALFHTLPLATNAWTEVTVALARVANYLLADEVCAPILSKFDSIDGDNSSRAVSEGDCSGGASLTAEIDEEVVASEGNAAQPTLQQAQLNMPGIVSFVSLGKISRQTVCTNGSHDAPQIPIDDCMEESCESEIELNQDEQICFQLQQQQWQPRRRTMFGGEILRLTQASAVWPDGEGACFYRVNMSVRRGEFVIVAGKVGSGKSSLFASLLGELPLSSGSLRMGTARVAYASQEPWLIGASLRANILFGEPMDMARYAETLRTCALLDDIAAMPALDLTSVGAFGCALSSGQRARVHLARALYQQADMYLLDDPLSSVDGALGRRIFRAAICDNNTKLLAGKTIIMSTNELDLLQYADKVLVLNSDGAGSRSEYGTLKDMFDDASLAELTRNNHPTASLYSEQSDSVRREGLEARVLARIEQLDELLRRTNVGAPLSTTAACTSFATGSGNILDDDSERQNRFRDIKYAADVGGHARRLSWFAAMSYICGQAVSRTSKGCGIIEIIVLVILHMLTHIAPVLITTWYNFWTYDHHAVDSMPVDTFVRAMVFTECERLALIGTICLLALAVIQTLHQRSVYARATMHLGRQIVVSIFNAAPARFNSSSSLGEHLCRLLCDTSQLHSGNGSLMRQLTNIGSELIFVAVLALIVSNMFCLWWPTIVCIVALALCTWVAFAYIRPLAMCLRQADADRRAAVYAFVSETAADANAMATIRASRSKQSTALVRRFDALHDQLESVRFVAIAARRWMCTMLDWCLLLLVCLAVLLLDLHWLAEAVHDHTWLMMSFSCVLLFVRHYQDLIELALDARLSDGNYVARMRATCELTQAENTGPTRMQNDATATFVSAALKNAQGKRAAFAPTISPLNTCMLGTSAASVEFVGVSVAHETVYGSASEAYSTASSALGLQMALRNVSFRVNARERLAIVGRSGSGKSLLARVLLRLCRFEGFVLVDGRDTKRMDASDLRDSVAMVTQESALFAGSLRRNLDPNDEHDDDAIWRSLDIVQLRPMVALHKRALAMDVGASGSNLSAGQRRLVCLARALLSRARLLVLDEPTAHVDSATEALIHRTLAAHLAERTVIMIAAHRIAPLLVDGHVHRILVLDAGQVREFGTPAELLARPRSALSRLCIECNCAAELGERV